MWVGQISCKAETVQVQRNGKGIGLNYFLRTSPPSLGRDTLGLGTPLQGDSGAGHSGVGHSRETLGWRLWAWEFGDTLGLGTPWRLWGWALRRHSGVGHSRVGHSRETLGVGTPRTL